MAAVESHLAAQSQEPPPPPPRQPASSSVIGASGVAEEPVSEHATATAAVPADIVGRQAVCTSDHVHQPQHQRSGRARTTERSAIVSGSHAATQLEFTQAMSDFKTMFSEMDDDVIEIVLRANQGAVDATIDQLLAMNTDNENERIRTEMDARENAESPPSYSPVTPPPTYQQCSKQRSTTTSSATATAICTPKAASQSSNGDVIPMLVVKNWCPPLLGPLPCDFLRIAGQWETITSRRSRRTIATTASGDQQQLSGDGVNAAHVRMSSAKTTLCSEVIQQKIEENERRRRMSAASGDDNPDLARCLEDERIALFLQNEEFMSELRSNRDFLSTLERDNSDSDTERPTNDASATPPAAAVVSAGSKSDESEAVFREKLTNMGKKSKRKFAQLARLFSRQKKRTGAKQMYPYARLSDGGVGSMPSRDHLLLADNDDEDADGDYSEDDDGDDAAAGRPQNEYHSFKNSSSPSLQRCGSNAT